MAYQTTPQRIHSNPMQANLLAHYRNPVDCLTAHLMLECSEVLAGVKPANLVSLVNRTRPCGRNMYILWNQYHHTVAQRLAGLKFMVLQNKERAVLLLCYDPQLLFRHLDHAGIRVLLNKAGYQREAAPEQLLDELQKRVLAHEMFPHEIGLFIGYPAKDVAAFMGLIKLPFACQGPWKIFGNPSPSLDLAEQYRSCRQRMSTLLASGQRRALLISDPGHPFYQPTNDNEIHVPYRSTP